MEKPDSQKTILDLGMKLRIAYNHDMSLLERIAPYKDYIDGVYVTSNFKVFPSSGALIRGDINWDTYDQELGEIMKYLRGHGMNVYMLLNGTNFSPDIVKNYKKSELRKYLKNMVEKNGLDKIVIFSLLLGLKIKEDFPQIKLEASANAYVDSLEKAKYWAEYGKVEGVCVHQRLNKRPDILKQIKEQTGLQLAVIANDSCLVNCPNEICHNNFCTYEGGSLTSFDCEDVISGKPWYAFHQGEIVPANLRYFKGIVDIVKLEGRAALTDNMINLVKQYATQIDSYEYPNKYLRTVCPMYPFYVPYVMGKEPPEVFEKVSKCSTNCEECGYCYKKWKEYYNLGDGIDYFVSGYKKFRNGQYSAAAEEFNNYIKGGDNVNDKVYYYLGLCYEESGDYGKAIEFFKRAHGGKPLSYEKSVKETEDAAAEIFCEMGSCYIKLGEYNNAVNSLLEAQKIKTGWWNVYNLMGVAYRELGKCDEAVSALKKAVELSPQEWRNYNVFGNTYMKQGRYAEAVPMLKKALELCDVPVAADKIKDNLKFAETKTGIAGA